MNIQKFEPEIRELKKLRADKTPAMHILLKEQIKQKIMLALDDRQPVSSRPATTLRVKIFRYAGAVLIGLSISAGTVFAASGSALPGDALYPVKQIKEQVELGLAATPKAKAQVKAKHAKERIKELDKISQKIKISAPAGPAGSVADISAGAKPARAKAADQQIRTETEEAVSGAIETLKSTKRQLELSGQKQDAADLDDNLADLQSIAEQKHLIVPREKNDRGAKNRQREDGPDGVKKSGGQ